MRRSFILIGLLVLAGVFCLTPADAFWQSRDSNYNVAVTSYSGPGDIVSGPVYAVGVRAFTRAYATSQGDMLSLRRQNDSVTCDVDASATGGLGLTVPTCNSSTQGGITAAAFAGTDATASCSTTGSSTSLVCTGAFSTPHANDPISGTGITQPAFIISCGTFTAGAGTCTMNAAQNIAVAETVTFQNALFIHAAYDMSGNGFTAGQGTTTLQPQLLLLCLNVGTLPCMYFNGSTYLVVANANPYAQPYTYSMYGERVGNFTGVGVYAHCSGQAFIYGPASANEVAVNASNQLTAPATDSTPHSIQGIINNTFSEIVVDNGTPSTGSAGASTCTGTEMQIGASAGTVPGTFYLGEMFFYSFSFSNTQISNMTTNQLAYY
jgi:hypothetical protein